MKKIICAIFSLLMMACTISNVHATGDIRLLVSEKIAGNVGVPLVSNIYVTTENEEFNFIDVEIDDDVTSWLNLPDGDFKAVVVSLLEDGKKLEIEVRGTPEEECDDYIIVTVPKGHIENYLLEDLSNDPIEAVVYDITYLPIECYYTLPSTIAGTVSEPLDKQYVYIKVEGDNIALDIEGQIMTEINGLTATCEYLDLAENTISVYFEGTPENQSHEMVDITLPKGSLETNGELALHVPFREDVLYNINPKAADPAPLPDPEPINEPILIIPTTGID